MMQQGHLSSEVLRRYQQGLLDSELMRAVKVFLATNPLYADAADGVGEFEDEAALEASLNLLEKRREKLLKGRSNVSYLRFEWIQRAALLAAGLAMVGITSFVIQWFSKEAQQNRHFAELKKQEKHVTVVTEDPAATAQAEQFGQGQQPIASSRSGNATQGPPPPARYEAAPATDQQAFPAPKPEIRTMRTEPTAPPMVSPSANSRPAAAPTPYATQAPQSPAAESESLSSGIAYDDADAAMQSAPAAAPSTKERARTYAEAKSEQPTAADLLARAEQLLAKQDTAQAIPLLEQAAKAKDPAGKKAAELLKKIRKH